MTQYTCAHCGQLFAATHDLRRKYCTPTCRTRASSKAQIARAGNWKQLLCTHPKTCPRCGLGFLGKKAQRYCSRGCSQAYVAAALAERTRKGTDLAPRQLQRVHIPVATIGRTWVNGACGWCEASFTAAAGSRYCSDKCKNAATSSRRHRERGWFSPTPAKRRRVYARDNGICHLCEEAVSLSDTFPHKLAATLDHIEPQSLSLSPNHADENLALAHMICNSIRQNDSVTTTLKAKCRERVLLIKQNGSTALTT